jgi:hypothetical protein
LESNQIYPYLGPLNLYQKKTLHPSIHCIRIKSKTFSLNQEFYKKNASIHAFIHFQKKKKKSQTALSSTSFTLNFQHQYNTRARARQRMAEQEQESARVRAELDEIKGGMSQMREMLQALTFRFEVPQATVISETTGPAVEVPP